MTIFFHYDKLDTIYDTTEMCLINSQSCRIMQKYAICLRVTRKRAVNCKNCKLDQDFLGYEIRIVN